MTHGFLPEGPACCYPLIARLQTVTGDCANLGWSCRCLGKALLGHRLSKMVGERWRSWPTMWSRGQHSLGTWMQLAVPSLYK